MIFYISFIYDFFFLWRVQCIFRVVRQINKCGFTWTASKGLHGLTCKLLWTSSNNKHIRNLDTLTRSGEKQNSSKTWVNLTAYDTFNQTVKFSVTLLTLCVSGNFAYYELKTLVPANKPHPKFRTFFPWKKCGLYAGKYGTLIQN